MVPYSIPAKKLEYLRDGLVSRFVAGEEFHFLEEHTEALDNYFRDSFERSQVARYMRIDQNPYVFIALGGYGRKEQCLYSDVDVLVLFKKKVPEEAKKLIQEIFYPLWDMGLEIGHTVRSVKECIRLASQDIAICTSLFDARFLCGVSVLYKELLKELHEKMIPRQKAALIEWLVDTSSARHDLYGDSTYLLEPNLKEGLGGLRDYHTMLWLTHISSNLKEPRDLEYYGHLSHQEFLDLSQALSFIWKVRNWLHYLNGRKTDRLYFEYQVKLADALNFKKDNGQEPVEQFLGILHGHMELLKHQHLMILHRISPSVGGTISREYSRDQPIKGLKISQDMLGFETPEAILENPHLLVRIFEHCYRLGISLSAEARRLIREFLYLIDDDFRIAEPVTRCLRNILTAPNQQFDALDEMLSTGVLSALIPEISGVINRVQYDAYHLYPVDKHSLRTIQTLKNFPHFGSKPGETLHEKIFHELKHPEILLWAGLLHDIGKSGDGKNHAQVGAEIARTVLERIGFSHQDTETVCFLIRYHLLLLETATRRDINDETVVVQCAGTIGTIEHLKMLYLLTIADSIATGPKAWNDWTNRLLTDLFFKLHGILERGELASPKATQEVEKKRRELFDRCIWMSKSELESIFKHMSPRYLLNTSTEDMIRHIKLYQRLEHQPFVWEVNTEKGTKYRIVTICAQDRPGLFSRISGAFTLNSIDILSAEIHTWRNHIALDIFTVKAPPDEFREQETWIQAENNLKSALDGSLQLDLALKKRFIAYQTAQGTPQVRPSKIIVDNHSSKFFTIIEVYTHDYTGLLFSITDALFRCRLDVWVAKIATKVDQVVDVFYVRDFDGQKLDDIEQIEVMTTTVQSVLTPPWKISSETGLASTDCQDTNPD
jgi:[protein-PII] uridylyltransferase